MNNINESNKRTTASKILIAFTTTIFLILLILLHILSFSVSNQLPKNSEYRRSINSNGISFVMYENFRDISKSDVISISSELLPQKLENIFNYSEIKPVLVNENFFDLNNIFVGGSKITKTMIENKTKAIVISQNLALKLTLSGQSIGKTIKIQNNDFTIVGIYKSSDDFLSKISSDMYDRVYLPYTSNDEYEDIPIDVFSTTANSNSEKTLILMGIKNNEGMGYFYEDNAAKSNVIKNMPMLLYSFIMLFIVVLILKFLYKFTKSTIIHFKEKNEETYLLSTIKINWKWCVSRTIGIFGGLLVSIVMVLHLPFKFIIFQKYIPNDNIFDIEFYKSVFINDMQRKNSYISAGNNFYCNLYDNAFIVSVFFAVVILILLLIVMYLKNLKPKNGY
ncbi:membrane protein [Clostridia bacterium]|nr:membrane protein [Clostridia bacterium]